MKYGRIAIVSVSVDDLKEAMSFYSRLFNLRFTAKRTLIREGNVKWAIAPNGFELVERVAKAKSSDSLRSIHISVPSVTRAKEDMKKKGLEPIEEVTIGRLREAVYLVRGLRIILIDYHGRR